MSHLGRNDKRVKFNTTTNTNPNSNIYTQLSNDRLPQQISSQLSSIKNQNKIRTNLIIFAHEDLKATKTQSNTRINSKNLSEFEKEFNGAVVCLKEETYLNLSSADLHKEEKKFSRDNINISVNANITTCDNTQTHINVNNFHLNNLGDRRSSLIRKEFCLAERKFSISQKKIKHFTDNVLKKHKEEIDLDEYDGLRFSMTSKKSTTSVNREDYSIAEKINMKRKISKIRMKEKLLKCSDANEKLEAAGKSFDYLQEMCKKIKLDEFEFMRSGSRNARYSKSCGKKEIKILQELMKNLEDSCKGSNKNKSAVTTNMYLQVQGNTTSNMGNNSYYKPKIGVTNNNNSNNKYCLFQGKNISVNKRGVMSTNIVDNLNIEGIFYQNTTNNNTSESSSNTLPTHKHSADEFSIQVVKCGVHSSRDSSITDSEFSCLSPHQDFSIKLRNCRKSHNNKDNDSRKVSEISPAHSLREEL